MFPYKNFEMANINFSDKVTIAACVHMIKKIYILQLQYEWNWKFHRTHAVPKPQLFGYD